MEVALGCFEVKLLVRHGKSHQISMQVDLRTLSISQKCIIDLAFVEVKAVARVAVER